MTGTYIFREPNTGLVVCHVYCPKSLSHASRLLSSQQLTAMCLSTMTRELISVGLSATQRLTPEGSPVTVFSDNKPH